MLSLFSGILDRLFAVIGVLIFMQMPLFMHQYSMQLRGHVAELNIQMRALEKAAGDRNVRSYANKFIRHDDPDINAQGELIHSTLERYQNLRSVQQQLSQASIWSRPFLFVATIQPAIAWSTLTHFQAGLVLTWEGAVYALLGLFFGMAIFRLLAWLCTIVRKCLV